MMFWDGKGKKLGQDVVVLGQQKIFSEVVCWEEDEGAPPSLYYLLYLRRQVVLPTPQT